MSSGVLSEAERASLDLILEDLRYLFDKEEILRDEVDDVLAKLRSEEVRSYIKSLSFGSKPETALRESFIAGKSVLLKFLFGEAIPEVRSDGFIDYLVKDEMGRGIALELKPLFEADVELDKSGKPILKRLKQRKLRPENYASQVLKYIQSGEAQFVILTNLKEWFFYSKELSPSQVKPFYEVEFFDFIRDYEVVGNLRDYLERKEFESIRYDLDKWFLESLKVWVKKLSEVEFTVDDRRKLELIIGLINKFIFVQTLDDYGVIEFNWIRKRWSYQEQMWQRKGKFMVLKKFFDELDDWFYRYYDTELFKEKILDYVKKDKENIEKLYRNLQLVLGLTYLQVPFGAMKGIMQYNFRYIDEDVLGKAYETFLAEVRKEKGVYYTPKYITQYIAENTVGKVFDEILAKIREELDKEEFNRAKELVLRFTSVRVLDLACGSGSFLIKTIRIIANKYKELSQLVENAEKRLYQKYSNYFGSLDIPQEIRVKMELLSEIREILGPRNKRELIARILVRHIHGVDLDKRALEVAKVNIWLEAIKLAPKEFRYDKLPGNTNYILPNLEMNLCNGDSLIGLPEETAIAFLIHKHQFDIEKLNKLRYNYLKNPTEPGNIDEIESIKISIRKELNEEFKKYLSAMRLPTQIINETKPFHWALEFWYVFFDKNGKTLPKDQQGFDIIIGNPPYVFTRGRHFTAIEKEFYWQRYFYEYRSQLKLDRKKQSGKINTYSLFIMKGIELLKYKQILGFIVQNNLLRSTNLDITRKFILENCSILEIDDLGPGIFEGVTAATINIFLRKEPNIQNRNNNTIKVINFRSEPKEVYHVPQKSFLNNVSYVFSIYADEKVSYIFEKIQKNTIRLGDICKVIIEGIVTPKGKSKFITNEQINNFYKPFIEGKDIKKYWIDYKGKYILYDRKKLHRPRPEFVFTSKEKIVVRRIGGTEGIVAAYDNNQYYTFASINNIILKDKCNYDAKYITGLLNSSLMSCYYLLKFSNKSELTVNISRTFLEVLPIYQATKEQQLQVVKLVDKIITLCKTRQTLRKLWKEWSTILKNEEHSLQQILINDACLIRQGEFHKTWTKKVTFYPSSKYEEMNKEFDQFRLEGDIERSIIRIYGLNRDGTDELIYEMTFNDENLMVHIYLSMLEVLESTATVKTLSQLFTKTTIPLIKETNRGSNELTPNIIKKVTEELESWLKHNKVENMESNVIKIDNEIRIIEAKIDALIFKLYKLTEEEIKVIFDRLKKPLNYRENVLKFFRSLNIA